MLLNRYMWFIVVIIAIYLSLFSVNAFEEKAAALMHALARNHPLIDGNKRLAWSATRIFCLMNGHDIDYSVVETEILIVGIARGDYEVAEIVELLKIISA